MSLSWGDKLVEKLELELLFYYSLGGFSSVVCNRIFNV